MSAAARRVFPALNRIEQPPPLSFPIQRIHRKPTGTSAILRCDQWQLCFNDLQGKSPQRTMRKGAALKHKCKVMVIDKKLFPELQKDYLADSESGPCPCFEVGQEYLFEREAGKDDFYHFGRELNPPFPCAEAWDAVSRYIYTALAGGAIMKNWTNDERIMIACCNAAPVLSCSRSNASTFRKTPRTRRILRPMTSAAARKMHTRDNTNLRIDSQARASVPGHRSFRLPLHARLTAKRAKRGNAIRKLASAQPMRDALLPPKEGHDRSFLLRYATPSRVPLAMTSYRASCSLSKRSLGSSEPNPAAYPPDSWEPSVVLTLM